MRPIRHGGTAAALAATAIAACAAPAAFEQRIVVKLARASDDGTAIAAEASRRAGVPARYAASVSGQWHALMLRCADRAACGAAVAALARAGDVYESVRIDERARIAASAAPG